MLETTPRRRRMGLLVDGVWQDHDRDIAGAGGTFARTKSTFRNWVTADGAPGPSGGARTLSPLCRPLLPLGTSHPDLPRAEEAGRRDLALDRLAADEKRQLG